MLGKLSQKRPFSSNRNVKRLAAAALLLAGPSAAAEGDLNAGYVVQQMNPDDRYPYVMGIVEGISFARYMRDGKKVDGMRCIYEWAMREGTVLKVYEAFAAFPEYAPAAVVTSMAEKECGE